MAKLGRPSVSLRERFFAKVELIPFTTCWLWNGAVFRHGYGMLQVDGAPDVASRISWRLHFGPIPDGLFVLHHCDVRLCVNPDHLFLGTHLDNMRDMTAKGRRAGTRCGELSATAKITEANAVAMFELREMGLRVKDIARRFDITPHHVSDILHGRYWPHVRAARLL